MGYFFLENLQMLSKFHILKTEQETFGRPASIFWLVANLTKFILIFYSLNIIN